MEHGSLQFLKINVVDQMPSYFGRRVHHNQLLLGVVSRCADCPRLPLPSGVKSSIDSFLVKFQCFTILVYRFPMKFCNFVLENKLPL